MRKTSWRYWNWEGSSISISNRKTLLSVSTAAEGQNCHKRLKKWPFSLRIMQWRCLFRMSSWRNQRSTNSFSRKTRFWWSCSTRCDRRRRQHWANSFRDVCRWSRLASWWVSKKVKRARPRWCFLPIGKIVEKRSSLCSSTCCISLICSRGNLTITLTITSSFPLPFLDICSTTCFFLCWTASIWMQTEPWGTSRCRLCTNCWNWASEWWRGGRKGEWWGTWRLWLKDWEHASAWEKKKHSDDCWGICWRRDRRKGKERVWSASPRDSFPRLLEKKMTLQAKNRSSMLWYN